MSVVLLQLERLHSLPVSTLVSLQCVRSLLLLLTVFNMPNSLLLCHTCHFCCSWSGCRACR
jgi:hypothetical protein